MSKPIQFYLATRLENIETAKAVIETLQSRGLVCTYDWTTHGPVWAGGKERLEEVAIKELGGVFDADVVIVILPGGRGTHVEMGFAMGLGKPIILVGDGRNFEAHEGTCAFYHCEENYTCAFTMQDIFKKLVEIFPRENFD
jgi:nucleoside 2-deoxyribosyltransferase